MLVSINFRQAKQKNKQTIIFRQMEQKEYTQMTDQELLAEAKKLKSFSITNALLIGFLAGVIFYSVVKNSWGMLTLIPLYFIYIMTKEPKNKKVKELQSLFKERNLKW